MMIRLRKSRLMFVLLWGLMAGGTLPAVARDDFVVILDQSGSMREKVPGIGRPGHPEDYDNPLKAPKSKEAIQVLNEVVISKLLKDGDYFALIAFGDGAKVVISQEIHYLHERGLIQEQIRKLLFQDNWTDIPASINESKRILESLSDPQHRKILFLITDGKNEPPDKSPFRRPEQQQSVYSTFREAIHKEGWNVNLVGLGPLTDLSQIADSLGLPQDKVVIELNRSAVATPPAESSPST